MLRTTMMNRAFCCTAIIIMLFLQAHVCRATVARWDSEGVSASHAEKDPNTWVQACSPCESDQAEVQISALSSDFLVLISGRAPFLARWVITGEQLILRENQGREDANVSDSDRFRLVFGVMDRRPDALIVAPLSLFGMDDSMRESVKSAPSKFAGAANITLTPYPKNLVLSFRRDGMVAGDAQKVNIIRLPNDVMGSKNNEIGSPYADALFGSLAPDCHYFECTQSDIDERKRAPILRWRIGNEASISTSGEPRSLVVYIDSATPVELRSYVQKGIEAWNDVFRRLGYSDAIVAKQLPEGFNDYDDVRYTVLCWASWQHDERNNERGGCSSANIYDPRSGELIQRRIATGGLGQIARYVVAMGGVDDRLSERLLPLDIAGDLVAMVAAHETGHVLGLRDGSYGGGSLTLRDVTSPERIAKNGFSQSIMNYSRFNLLASPGRWSVPQDLVQSIGPADYYWIAWGYAGYGTCFSLNASVSNGCSFVQRLPACEEECRRYLAGRPIWADPYDVYESLPIDDPIAASEAALTRLRLGVIHAFSRELAFESSSVDLRSFITPPKLYVAAIQLWSESQLQAASVIGATSPYCEDNVQSPGCSWSSIEDEAMNRLKRSAFRLPDFLLSDEVLAMAGLSRQEAFDLAAQTHPTLLSVLLNSHRVKELARRSLEGAGHANDGVDLASLLKDIRGELWAGGADQFASRMQAQYLQLLTDLKGLLGRDSDSEAKIAVDLISREIDQAGGTGMRGS